MSEAVIKDTCRCGAIFSMAGYHSYAERQHKVWLDDHKVCRQVIQRKPLIHSEGKEPER